MLTSSGGAIRIIASVIKVKCENCAAPQELSGPPVTEGSRYTCSACGREQKIIPDGAASLVGTINASEVTILTGSVDVFKM